VIVRVLILWAVIALAVALSVLAHRWRKSEETHEYQVVLGFVGSAYGLLLGLLVVFAVGHYSDTRREAQREASSLVALWDALDVYPGETRDAVRHDLICYMRAIVADDWPAMERGSRLEDPRTLAFGDRVRGGIRGLPLDDERQRAAYGRSSTLISDAGASRQQLLFFTEPEVPTVLWVLIYVGAFLLVFLVGTHYAERPRGLFAALGSVAALLTVIVVVLTMLDNPFTAGARVQPDSMRDAIDLVSVDGDRAGVLRPCPQNPEPIGTEAS
jgi:multisubunit Na+/H+ antiporter MnhB subunit